MTVTATEVIAPSAELDETVDRPPPIVDLPEEPGISIDISTSSGSTTLKQGSTAQLTISVTENGNSAAGKTLSLSVPSDKATISPTLGITDEDGELQATLTIKNTAPVGEFNITAGIANTNHSKKFPITVKTGPGSIDIGISPATIEPGQTSSISFRSRTPSGDVFPNTQLTVSAPAGTINPTLVTTDSDGRATVTYRASPYVGYSASGPGPLNNQNYSGSCQ